MPAAAEAQPQAAETMTVTLTAGEVMTIRRALIELRAREREGMDDFRRQYRPDEANAVHRHIRRIAQLLDALPAMSEPAP